MTLNQKRPNALITWFTTQFELSRAGSAQNVRPMEGVRGFAVFLVFIVHYVTLVQPWITDSPLLVSFLSALHSLGNRGVDLFFVLSGFLIYGSLIQRPQKFTAFMMRRIQRIYPVFTVVFILYVVLSYLFPSQNKIPSSFIDAISFVLQNYLLLPGLFSIEPIITVAWSLSYEMFYYIALPIVIVVLKLRERKTHQRLLFFGVLTLLIILYCAFYGGHIRLIMFISGIFLYEATITEKFPVPNSLVGIIALVCGLLVSLLPLSGSVGFVIKIVILFGCFFIVCYCCFLDSSKLLPKAFSWTPLRWLGNMSYSYYLIHGLSLKGAFMLLAILLPQDSYGSWFFWGGLPCMFALTLCVSTVLFVVIERPYSLAITPAPK